MPPPPLTATRFAVGRCAAPADGIGAVCKCGGGRCDSILPRGLMATICYRFCLSNNMLRMRRRFHFGPCARRRRQGDHFPNSYYIDSCETLLAELCGCCVRCSSAGLAERA
ncbi:hypothetical protein EVAR_24921_1 [Eumeta japonica]|uniref:Uncharacterized protein n=1 Tax=Eumeta variegata TaxID=151549 RepID=A0A4C1V6V9_EUMVA|nr:hypothetical protein EVAR_24921_1 [Eumeta japonica]